MATLSITSWAQTVYSWWDVPDGNPSAGTRHLPEKPDFTEGEYAQVANCIREYADMNVPLRKFASAGANDAAKERPFVTNRLWSIFFVLQGLYGRTSLLLTNSYKESRLINWRTDSGCDQLLRAILPAQFVEHAKGQPIGGLRTAIDFLESEFLTEAGMNKSHA